MGSMNYPFKLEANITYKIDSNRIKICYLFCLKAIYAKSIYEKSGDLH